VACGGATRRAVLAPLAPQGLRRALDDLDVLSRLEPPVRLILWLDRVDTFAPDGSTVEMLRRCRQRSPGLWVVATISTTRYRTWAPEEAPVAAEFGEPVTLERLPSASELARAESTYPAVDFSEGIAAAFTAAGSLLVRLRGGDGDCPYEPPGGDCPVARAVVAVALGWAATGTSRPMPLALLTGLVQQRLGRAEELDSRHLARAVEWACAPTLQGARLVRPVAEDPRGTVWAHPEVAEIRAAEEPPAPAVWTAALDEAVAASDSDAVGRIGFHAHVAGEAEAAAAAWAHIGRLDEAGANWLRRAAGFSHTRGEPRAEVPLRQRRLELSEAEYGPDHVEVARTLTNLGAAWRGLGKPEKARDVYERALRIFEREYGPDHVDVAITLTNLGAAWRGLGKPDTARGLHERALRIFEREYGPDHVEVARTLTNLGAAWRGLGKPDTARDLHERALRIFEREYGPDHVEVARTLTNLGTAWRELGKPDTARDLHERALRIFEREYGPDHVEVARTLANLGTAWSGLGKPEQARDLYVRALRIFCAHYPNGHPHREVVVGNLRRVAPDLVVLDDGRVVSRTGNAPPTGS